MIRIKQNHISLIGESVTFEYLKLKTTLCSIKIHTNYSTSEIKSEVRLTNYFTNKETHSQTQTYFVVSNSKNPYVFLNSLN